MSAEAHVLRGSFRSDRHGKAPALRPDAPLSVAVRRRVLTGLPKGARRLAETLIDEFDGWDAAMLTTLRAYVLSCARLAALQDDPDVEAKLVHREVRCNLALLKSLGLERQS